MSIKQKTHKTRTTSLGWMIQRIAGRLNKAMEGKLSAHGLNLQHFAVMMTVLEFDGLTQTQIGERFSMPAYAISRAIDHLEQAGYLERRLHPTSRRAHTIHATENGKALGAPLRQIVKDVNMELTKPLSKKQREDFNEILQTLL